MIELSERTKNYKGSEIRRLAQMLEKIGKKGVISFGGGAPSLAPPREVTDYLIEQLKKDPQAATAYSSTIGLPEVRKLISENLKDGEKVDIDPDGIMITIGGTEGLFITLAGVLNPGEEVILADPTYLVYPEPIKFIGGKPVYVKARWQENFQMFPDKINEKITNKTKAVLFLSPDNPTGRVEDKENIKGIVELCEDHDLWLVTDDAYKDIVYDEKFYNTRLFGGYDRTISCCSFSKSASLPGLRIGYTYGPKEIIQKIVVTEQGTSLSSPTLPQLGVKKFLENGAKVKKEYISKTVIPTYRKRRDKMAECFKKYLPHVEFAKPEGAFYFFIDFKENLEKKGLNEHDFADKLFEEKKVVIIPGPPFGEFGKNHFRFTFVSENEEKIEEGMKKVAEFVGA